MKSCSEQSVTPPVTQVSDAQSTWRLGGEAVPSPLRDLDHSFRQQSCTQKLLPPPPLPEVLPGVNSNLPKPRGSLGESRHVAAKAWILPKHFCTRLPRQTPPPPPLSPVPRPGPCNNFQSFLRPGPQRSHLSLPCSPLLQAWGDPHLSGTGGDPPQGPHRPHTPTLPHPVPHASC